MTSHRRFNVLLFCLLSISLSSANYRHYYLDNADICNGSDGDDSEDAGGGGILGGSSSQWFKLPKTQPTRVLNIGTGAAIFTLSSPSSTFQPSYRNQARRCEVHLKAADDSYGLMAYVEEMHMRKSTKDGTCVDSVQFGQDDIVPFLTLVKSPRHCGEIGNGKKGIFYDDPHGSLLLWVSLGGRRPTSAWPIISVVNLTLVVTAYQKECGNRPRPNFKKCRERDRCIWSHYFCDRHVNCAKDAGTPADEEGCKYVEEVQSTTSATAGEGGGRDGSGQQGESSFNLVSLTLITVCSGISVLFFIVVTLRYRQQKRCCFWQSGENDAVNANPTSFTNVDVDRDSQRARSIAELSRIRRMRETPEAANIYLPLDTFRDPNQSSAALMETSMTRQQLLRRQEEEESPPAYEELFPDRPSREAAGGGAAAVIVGNVAAPVASQNVPAVQDHDVQQDGEQVL